MNKEEVIKILTTYNAWRRGVGLYSIPGTKFLYTPQQLSEALDFTINYLQDE